MERSAEAERTPGPGVAAVALDVPTDLAAMEAELVEALPQGDEWQYEPKWDGFRALVFRDADAVEIRSKAGKPLARYFPDLVGTLLALPARRFVLDGEIVIPVEGKLSFEELQLRLHPAESRVRKLAAARPSELVAFDLLLAERGGALLETPFSERRRRLEAFAGRYFRERIHLCPATRERSIAERWLAGMDGLDGIVAKRRDLPYQPGERAMVKVKRFRTAECVVGGFRYSAGGGLVGSLLLGLYDDEGLLHHVGYCSAFQEEERKTLTEAVERLKGGAGFTGRKPGGPSRWNRGKSNEWEPVGRELVVEVEYDHFTGGRFRHGTRFVRTRPDKAPGQCSMQQVQREAEVSLELLERRSVA